MLFKKEKFNEIILAIPGKYCTLEIRIPECFMISKTNKIPKKSTHFTAVLPRIFTPLSAKLYRPYSGLTATL